MRLSYLLLVATATVLASCNTVAATSKIQAKLSTITSSADPSRELESSNGKRFLRSFREEDENDEEEEEEEEEERAIMTPAQIAKWTARADDWVEAGHSPAYIKDKLTGLNGKMNAKNKEKYRLFGAAWGRAHPGELGRM